jgi:DNA-binding IclR family transcriptional regulator
MARAPSKTVRPPADAEPGSVLDRAFGILDLVASTGRPLTILEISEAATIPKPTVHRLCAKLEDSGFLTREPTGRHFRSGPKLLSLSFNALRHDGARGERHAILEALVEEVGETCNFTMPAGNAVLYLDRVEARWPLRLQLEPGSRVPLHCTASGKLFLAALPPDRLDRMLGALRLVPHTPHTIATRAALEEELSRIAVRGYSLDNQEFLLGLVAIAVPVKDADNRTVAAVACHAPSARLSLEQALAHLPRMREAATRLAETLPGRGEGE